jgi:hypothetical protein
MAFSAECLQLREIKRTLRAIPTDSDHTDKGPWYRTMVNEYDPVEDRLCRRPVRTWTDCVELAETIWSFWSKQHRDGYLVGPALPKLYTGDRELRVYSHRHAVAALVEGVLTLGGGERFDPSMRDDER